MEFTARDLQEQLSQTPSSLAFREMGAPMLATLKRSYILFFDPYSKDGKVHIRDSFFTARHLSSGTGSVWMCGESSRVYGGI